MTLILQKIFALVLDERLQHAILISRLKGVQMRVIDETNLDTRISHFSFNDRFSK